MSTTLTNGLKLPDKGSVDWYADMQSNYAILDGAVGTIAEHTSALAGKAPLVHTHTKSDITDFPVYGNTAGTICEGNDSRLSDARTPVSHTHTKSDVTDLLNSDFIPSANNSYDLGSSRYQWNNLYAKNYYYNGVAWGLDKNNKWLTTNTFYGSVPIFLRGSDKDIYNVSPQSLVQSLIRFVDKNNTTMSSITFQHRTEATETHRLCIRQQKVTSDGYYSVNLNNLGCFYPELNGRMELGTSTNKWKSFNGVNPGALSLPTTDSTKWVDLSGSLTTNSIYTYTPAVDGWISVMMKRTGDATAVFLIQGNIKASCFSNTALVGESAFAASACIPVRAGISVDIHLKGSSSTIDSAYFIPCEGNV